MADVRRFAWLTGHQNTPAPDPRPDHPARPAPSGTEVLTEMLERCDRTSALLRGYGDGKVFILGASEDVMRSLGEMAIMLIAAGAELEEEFQAGDAPPGIGDIAAKFKWLGLCCQNRATPFARGVTYTHERNRAWKVLQEVAEFLRELLQDPRAASGGDPA